MPLIAGDLLTQSFKEIWETSPIFTDLREGELSGRCGRCEYKEVCGGCRARAYADTGDYLGPDDSCAYDPVGDKPLVTSRAGKSYGQKAEESNVEWTSEAYEKMEKIPSFVRGVVVERLEKYAKDKGYEVIDMEVMKKVREDMPVDFSKKRPFFLGRGGRA